MKNLRTSVVLLLLLLGIAPLCEAQVEVVRSTFFPADLEFKELQKIRSDFSTDSAAKVTFPGIAGFLTAYKFQRASSRTYDLAVGGTLSIETVSLADPREAYSLLTLSGPCTPAQGPPGGAWCADPSGLRLAAGSTWIRVESTGAGDLAKRVAQSVGNRAGATATTPSVVKHLPATGRRADSLRYYADAALYWKGPELTSALKATPAPRETEIATSSYQTAATQSPLVLLALPTSQVAEEYMEMVTAASSSRLYARRAGPIVGLLPGDVPAQDADAILSQISYSYSVKWIYDRNSHRNRTIWGVPVAILGTVVRSLVLTALLCFLSIAVGASLAAARLYIRRRSPNNIFDDPERTGLIRLKLHEK